MTVLIVDDSPPFRALIRTVLAGLADEVRECADGDEALAAYGARRPDARACWRCPGGRVRGRRSRAGSAPITSQRCRAAGGAALGTRAAGIERGDEVVTTPFSFVASANCVLYEGARPASCDIDPAPSTSSAGGGGYGNERSDRLCRCTSSATPPTSRASSGSRPSGVVDRRGSPARALGAVHPNGPPSVPVGTWGLRLLPQATAHDGGRGSAGVPAAAVEGRHRQRAHGARAPTWAGSTTTGAGSTPGSRTSPARWGWPSSSAWTRCAADRARVAASYSESLAGIEGLDLPCCDADGARRSWVVNVCSFLVGSIATRLLGELGRADHSKPYLPAIHWMSFYTRAFHHREEGAPGARSRGPIAALPSFPELTRRQVDRVATTSQR